MIRLLAGSFLREELSPSFWVEVISNSPGRQESSHQEHRQLEEEKSAFLGIVHFAYAWMKEEQAPAFG